MTEHEKTKEELLRAADAVRARLLRTVERLDHRRHDALDLPLQLERHMRQIAVAGAVLLVASASVVGFVVHRVTSAGERRRRARWRLLQRVWWHPEGALRAQRHSFVVEVGRAWMLSLVTGALSGPAQRAIAAWMDRSRSHPALAAARPSPHTEALAIEAHREPAPR